MIVGFLSALALAVALAMDAFAVALTQGARFRPGWREAALIGLAFGLFQGVMPLFGWLLGAFAFAYIAAWDHWIAFVLLAFLGVQMIRSGGESETARPLSGLGLLVASIATSVDAFAAGLTLPTLGFAPLAACVLIAMVTALLSATAVWLGRKAGDRFGRPAEVFGGVLLIALGAKILADHLLG